MGRSLIIAFALSHFWWHWQRKAKSAWVWAQTREGGLGPGVHAEGPGRVQVSWGMQIGAVVCQGMSVRARDRPGTQW